MNNCFETLISQRRSVYNINNNPTASIEEISVWVKECLLQCPTPFNSQSGRIILLFGKHHQKLWNITSDALQKITSAEQFSKTKNKILSFAAGFGTILYFIDDKITQDLQQQFPLYADNFPVWAEQANGILQFMVWSILSEHDIGASLQHYNPLIDADVKKAFSVPDSWRLIAQMPFGSITIKPEAKTFLPLENRIKIFKD